MNDDSNVISLLDRKPVTPEPEPEPAKPGDVDQAAVEMLERVLEEVKRGELGGIHVIGLCPHSLEAASWSTSLPGYAERVSLALSISKLEELKADLMDDMRGLGAGITYDPDIEDADE